MSPFALHCCVVVHSLFLCCFYLALTLLILFVFVCAFLTFTYLCCPSYVLCLLDTWFCTMCCVVSNYASLVVFLSTCCDNCVFTPYPRIVAFVHILCYLPALAIPLRPCRQDTKVGCRSVPRFSTGSGIQARPPPSVQKCLHLFAYFILQYFKQCRG